jgi:hypothetical protein
MYIDVMRVQLGLLRPRALQGGSALRWELLHISLKVIFCDCIQFAMTEFRAMDRVWFRKAFRRRTGTLGAFRFKWRSRT